MPSKLMMGAVFMDYVIDSAIYNDEVCLEADKCIGSLLRLRVNDVQPHVESTRYLYMSWHFLQQQCWGYCIYCAQSMKCKCTITAPIVSLFSIQKSVQGCLRQIQIVWPQGAAYK